MSKKSKYTKSPVLSRITKLSFLPKHQRPEAVLLGEQEAQELLMALEERGYGPWSNQVNRWKPGNDCFCQISADGMSISGIKVIQAKVSSMFQFAYLVDEKEAHPLTASQANNTE